MTKLIESKLHTVEMRFSDNVVYKLSVAENESILSAALAHDVPILHQCQSGSCGTCLTHLSSGDAQMDKGTAASLLKSERDAGMRLACITHASSDCIFEFDYTSTVGDATISKATLFIDNIEWVSEDVVHLTTELAEEDWFEFKSGQFIQMQIPGTNELRLYSMSSTPAELPIIKFFIRILPNGAMSDYLRNNAKVDDIISVDGAFGSFFLREDNPRVPHIMVAGGTGLAPIMSLIDNIKNKNGIKPDILLSFGCRNMDSLFYSDDLQLRMDWMPTLDVRISVNEGNRPENILLGNPVDALQASDVRDEDTVAYLCGPPGMVKYARSTLEGFGVKPDNIYVEQFIPSE
jgi:benzoate/toluate 1,2-dioxygenase reductase subunit